MAESANKTGQSFGSLFQDDYLIRNLGQIAHDPEVALTELVANAWDAGASLVDIWPPKALHGSLIVEDDGHGMSSDQFKGRWMKLRTLPQRLLVLALGDVDRHPVGASPIPDRL